MGTRVHVLMCYDGEWIQTGPEGRWSFKGKQSKGFVVSDDICYADLLDKIYSVTGVDKHIFDLELKVVYNYDGIVIPTEISSDDDVSFFLGEVLMSINRRPQLCVRLLEKKRCLENVVIGGEGCSRIPLVVSNTDVLDKSRVAIQTEKIERADANANFGIEDIEPYNIQQDNDEHAKEFVFQGEWENIVLEQVADEENINSAPLCRSKQQVINKQRVASNNLQVEHKPSTSQFMELVSSASSSVSAGSIKEGDLFENKKELKVKLHLYAMKKNFEFKVIKSATDIWVITCVDDNCKWRLRATKLNGTDTFEVRKMVDEHTCSLDVRHRDHRQAAPWLIGYCIKDMYTRPDPTYKARAIIEDMRKDYGFEMTYDKAWRCREKALVYVRGTPEMSYQKLPSWCYMLEKTNPGTITHILTDDEDQFKYCFMALGVSIRGFKLSCRPVIAVDGSFLKGVFGGTLLEAIAKDANGQIYPVAFGVVDSENHASWEWFLTKLRECLGEVENLVFVSDRHVSIKHALESVFPEAHHGACIHHISMNISANFKTESCHDNYFIAAKQYRRSQFHRYFEKIRAVNAEIAKYLEDIGFEKWTRAFFPGDRYDILTTGIAESMNNITVNARGYPITTMFEFIRDRLQKWFCERRTEAEKATTFLATTVEEELRQLADRSQTMRVHPISHHEFNVEDGELDGLVNLAFKTCTCRKFDLTRLPCEHALVAARYRNVSVYQLCSRLYTTEAWLNSYAESIYPVGKEEDWDIPDHIKRITVKPPVVTKRSGRRKQRRRKSQGEKLVKHRRCSRCGSLGHNRVSCQFNMQATPSTSKAPSK